MASNYYAHSERPEVDAPAQTYQNHIQGVVDGARNNAIGIAQYSEKYRESLLYIPVIAAEYHDFGKLAFENQKILSSVSGKALPIRHEDAGAFHLKQTKVLSDLYAAWLVFSHHRGLDSKKSQRVRGPASFRANQSAVETLDDTDKNYTSYLKIHKEMISISVSSDSPDQEVNSVFLRMALSCLVDADHGDTARHYNNESSIESVPKLEPVKRADLLDNYVGTFNGTDPYKDKVYEACKDANTQSSLYNCDSPVGSGKTTAVMRHMLQAAIDKKLRRIFVVLPFTNIINQSVDVYRGSLVKDSEDSEEVIAAHHHKADFQSPLSRQFAETWNSPIVVTTAVQFFETLASDRPSSLRKLHNLAGSAIFIDESHASLPTKLWPQALKWLWELAENWGCHIVFASGSSVRFWEMEEFFTPKQNDMNKKEKLPELIPETLQFKGSERERKRIKYRSRPEKMNVNSLCDWILETKDSARLIILNTVQSAAYIAKTLKEKEEEVYHLSSALTPYDREIKLAEIKKRLEVNRGSGWTLVATSVIEAGVDLSFDVGFRERSTLSSLIQASGRVNRKNDMTKDYYTWDFELENNGNLKLHPAFGISSNILQCLFEEHGELLNASFCTEAMLREIRQENTNDANKDRIINSDIALDFVKVAQEFKVIDSDTRVVLINGELADRIRNYDFPKRKEIMEHSIQIWEYKLADYGVTEINDSGIYQWDLAYDDFLGYMKGALESIEFSQGGGFLN